MLSSSNLTDILFIPAYTIIANLGSTLLYSLSHTLQPIPLTLSDMRALYEWFRGHFHQTPYIECLEICSGEKLVFLSKSHSEMRCVSVVAKSLYPVNTARSAQTGHIDHSALEYITDFHSKPQVRHFHHTFLRDLSFTVSGVSGRFRSDHSSASSGYFVAKSLNPLSNI